MALLYVDENFPQPAVEALRRLGHDVLTLLEAGRAGRRTSDETILSEAASQRRAVLTYNRKHFIHLHTERADHAGIIVCTVDQNFEGLATRIDAALREERELGGKLIRVNRPNP